jgi:vacuolar protein sorting-associated protein 18
MTECDGLCDEVRDDILRLRNHQMQMSATAKCALTHRPVLGAGEEFYVFPSGYVYLASALKAATMPYLNDHQKQRVDVITKELLSSDVSDTVAKRLQVELDGIIAAECPLTGTIMVESIDIEFGDSLEVDDEAYWLTTSVERVDV